MTHRHHPALGMLLVILAAGCSGSGNGGDERSAESAEAIMGGTVDRADPAIVLVIFREAAGSGVLTLCTGTVVSPHVVLTAAHCIDPKILGKSGQYGVFIGDDFNASAQWTDRKRFFTAKETVLHPSFDSSHVSELIAQHDLGLIVTSGALPATPVLISHRALDKGAVGSSVRVVGFGKSTGGSANATGKKLELATKISDVDDDHLIFDEQGGASVICEGDSGGPSLATRDGHEVIVGVHSFGEHAKSCTGRSYDQRVDADATAFMDPMIQKFDPGFDSAEPPAPPAPPAPLGEDASADGASSAPVTGGDGSSGCDVAGSSRKARAGHELLLVLVGLLGAFVTRRRAERRTPSPLTSLR